MTHTTTTDSSSTTTTMGNGNKKMTANSFSADHINKLTSKVPNKPVSNWTSDEVQNWIKEQCKNFELKKTVADKFEMNGQALMLLTKHDFIRRSPNGGEILYYALQRIINPNRTFNSATLDQSPLSNGLSGQQPQIVEINGDYDEINAPTDSSSKPIVEEPDDPPKIRRSQSDTNRSNTQQQQNHRAFYNQTLNQPLVYTMPAIGAAAYLHHQQGYPHQYMYTQPQLHMHHPQFYYPHTFQQYHPMMSAQGILIEIMDDPDPSVYASAGVNGTATGAQEQLYMVTANGQRHIMNETQAKQLVIDLYQQEAYQQDLQQQQLYQQQQQLFQQQQQYVQQQQQQQQQQQHQQQQQQQHRQQQKKQQRF